MFVWWAGFCLPVLLCEKQGVAVFIDPQTPQPCAVCFCVCSAYLLYLLICSHTAQYLTLNTHWNTR